MYNSIAIEFGKKKVSMLLKMVMLTLVISTITDFYGYGSINFTYIISVILALLCILKNRGIKNIMPKFLTVYLIWYAISYYLSLSSISFTSILPLGLIKIFLVYSVLFYEFNFQVFYKYYHIVAIICISYFLLQFFTLAATGVKLPGIIPGLPVISGGSGAAFIADTEMSVNVASFFSEKAKFAQFLLPLLCIELFNKEKKNWIFIVFVSVCIVLSNSGNGFLGLAVIAFCFFLNSISNGFSLKKILILIVISVSSLFFLGYYLSTEAGEKVLERQDQLTETSIGGASSGQSGFMRIYSGYYVFSQYNIWEQIVGINNGDGITKKIHSSPVSFLFEDDNLYFNNLFSVLIRTGYIGLFIMIMLIVSLWKKTDACGHSLLALFISLSFIASFFFINFMAIYFILPYCFSKKDKYKRKILNRNDVVLNMK